MPRKHLHCKIKKELQETQICFLLILFQIPGKSNIVSLHASLFLLQIIKCHSIFTSSHNSFFLTNHLMTLYTNIYIIHTLGIFKILPLLLTRSIGSIIEKLILNESRKITIKNSVNYSTV